MTVGETVALRTRAGVVAGRRIVRSRSKVASNLAIPAYLVILGVFCALRLLSVEPWLSPAFDLYAYWSTHLGLDFTATRPGDPGAFLYSPAFAHAIWPVTWLPWPLFAAGWTAFVGGVLVWLSGRWAIVLLFVIPVTMSIAIGQVDLLIAAAIVIGFRWPAAWALPILTKVTPGVGLLWFGVRRRVAIARHRARGDRRHRRRVGGHRPRRLAGLDRDARSRPVPEGRGRLVPRRAARLPPGDGRHRRRLGRSDRPSLDGARGGRPRHAHPVGELAHVIACRAHRGARTPAVELAGDATRSHRSRSPVQGGPDVGRSRRPRSRLDGPTRRQMTLSYGVLRLARRSCGRSRARPRRRPRACPSPDGRVERGRSPAPVGRTISRQGRHREHSFEGSDLQPSAVGHPSATRVAAGDDSAILSSRSRGAVSVGVVGGTGLEPVTSSV